MRYIDRCTTYDAQVIPRMHVNKPNTENTLDIYTRNPTAHRRLLPTADYANAIRRRPNIFGNCSEGGRCWRYYHRGRVVLSMANDSARSQGIEALTTASDVQVNSSNLITVRSRRHFVTTGQRCQACQGQARTIRDHDRYQIQDTWHIYLLVQRFALLHTIPRQLDKQCMQQIQH